MRIKIVNFFESANLVQYSAKLLKEMFANSTKNRDKIFKIGWKLEYIIM